MAITPSPDKSTKWLGWLLIFVVCGLSGASILVVLQDFVRHARSNGGVEANTYLFLYTSLAIGLLSISYQVSQRHLGRTIATGLGLLPVLGLLLLIGSTEGWTPANGWSTPVKQVAKSDSTSIFTYVEQEPALPTGGGLARICDALSYQAQRHLTRAGQSAEGTVRISWVVSRQGHPSQLHIEQGLSAAADSAVVAAVRELPALHPGKQNGQAVAVRLTAVARLSASAAVPQPIHRL